METNVPTHPSDIRGMFLIIRTFLLEDRLKEFSMDLKNLVGKPSNTGRSLGVNGVSPA
jgi:hypothetical protein